MAQQRVIDSVTISVEAETPVVADPPLGSDLIRVRVGSPGQGSVVIWIGRSAAPRFIAAIAAAMQMDPEVPQPVGDEKPEAEESSVRVLEEIPF